ncbi:hypothetical protein INT43_008216 [Umbelopsis isabellina]|uniref:Uncharacterized protein n=1 Tax=Mortierella isabellina TaxID=91625 RepID=A0A8H7PDC7_MORIS|nr:hypothetical protein INT43_008216 [Umbelopsis isabellina]
MSSAGPAYEIRFRDDEVGTFIHVQIIDLTRNGSGAESRRLPNVYRQSYLLRRESVMLSSSTTPTSNATAEYHEEDRLQQGVTDHDVEVSSLAVRDKSQATSSTRRTNASTASQPIPINSAASSSSTRQLAKSAPLNRNVYDDNEQLDTNFSWTTGRNNKNLDVIPTVARRLAEEEAMDHLRRQEGEEAMRKAMERKAKIAAARQNANKSSPDLRPQGSSKSEQTTHQRNSQHQPKDRIRMASVDYVKDTSAVDQSKNQSTAFEQRQAQDNNTRDIRKEVEEYLKGTDLRKGDNRLDSQPNVYPYNSYERMDANMKQPLKGDVANYQMKEQHLAYNGPQKSTKMKYDREYELSRLQEGNVHANTSISAQMNSETQDLGHDSSNDKKGCCCIIS